MPRAQLHRVLPAPFLFLVLSLLVLPSQLTAQVKLDENESVKVLFLGEWFDGTVVGKDKKLWYVEFPFAGTTKREAFDRVNIRKQCEIEAMDFARNWESSNGKFKLDAALKGVAGEDVVLVKLDLSEVTVPLSSLSAKDIAYVNKLKKSTDAAVAKGELPAAVPKLPDVEDFAMTFGATGGVLVGAGKPARLGEIPAYLKDFDVAGTGFRFTRPNQKLVAAIPVGGPERLVLMTAREDNFHNRGQSFQSQVYWVSLKQKKVLGAVALTPEDFVVDYDPRTQLMVSAHRKERNGNNQESDILTLWKMEAGATKAEPLVRWNAQVEAWPDSIFAKVIDDQTVLVKTDRKNYVAWDVKQKNQRYAFTSDSFFDAPVVLSADRQSLIVPEDGKVTVVNAQSGELRFSLRVPARHVAGANINAAGSQLVALTEDKVFVWDLATGQEEPKAYPAPLIGSPFQSRIEWIDDDHVLAESHSERILFRLSLGLPVWSYRMDVRQYFLNKDPLMNQVVGGKFFYVAEPEANSGTVAVGVVQLPGPKVDEVTANIDKESLWMVKPGTHVGLALGSVSDPAKVREWLLEKIKANGWVFDEQADIQLHAAMGVGQQQTQTYRELGIGRKETTVSFTPHFASLQLKKGDLVIWQSGSSTGAPPLVTGQNLQEQVTRQQVPQLEFFRFVKIDPKILDPKYSHGFGVSLLGLRGIEVQSTTPPGRADDPYAADQKVKSDQEQALEESRRNNPGGGNSP